MSDTISVPENITDSVAESDIDILLRELAIDGKTQGPLPSLIIEDNNKKFSVNEPVLKNAIEKCNTWINFHKQIVQNMQNFVKNKKSINSIGGKSSVQNGQLTWQATLKEYETSLKKGYAILQYIYRIVTGVKEKKYLIYVKGTNGYLSQEIELDISEMLNSVALSFKQNLNEITNLAEAIKNSSLMIYKRSVANKLRKTKDIGEKEQIKLKQTEEYIKMISAIYTANAKQGEEGDKDYNYNKGRAYEILKTIILNKKEEQLQDLLVTYKGMLRRDKDFLSNDFIFENDNKKGSFTKITFRKNDEEKVPWGIKTFIKNANSLFKEYQVDNIPSYANSGDIDGYELKYLENSVKLNTANVIVSGVVRALQGLKSLETKANKKALKQLRKGKIFLQGELTKGAKQFTPSTLKDEYQKVYEELLGLREIKN